MDVFCTEEGGDMARFGILTGNVREIATANIFSGAGTRTLREIEAFEIIHPDDVRPGMETSPVPDWISIRVCGIGKSLGKEWA